VRVPCPHIKDIDVTYQGPKEAKLEKGRLNQNPKGKFAGPITFYTKQGPKNFLSICTIIIIYKSLYQAPKDIVFKEMMFIKNKSLEQGLNLSRS
jgi:hypothetical protein